MCLQQQFGSLVTKNIKSLSLNEQRKADKCMYLNYFKPILIPQDILSVTCSQSEKRKRQAQPALQLVQINRHFQKCLCLENGFFVVQNNSHFGLRVGLFQQKLKP